MDVEIARIGSQRLLRGAATEAGSLKVAENLLSDAVDGAMELSAHGGLMHAEQESDFGKGTAIDIVGGQEKTRVGFLATQRRFNCSAQKLHLGGRLSGRGIGGRRVKFFDWFFAAGAGEVVHMALGQRGAEPADQRATAAVGLERATALSVACVEPVELRVELTGQVAAHRVAAGDSDCGPDQRLFIDTDKALPGPLVAGRAGPRQYQVVELQATEPGRLLLARCYRF